LSNGSDATELGGLADEKPSMTIGVDARPPSARVEVVQASRDERDGFVAGGGRVLSAFSRSWQSDLSPNVGVDGGIA